MLVHATPRPAGRAGRTPLVLALVLALAAGLVAGAPAAGLAGGAVPAAAGPEILARAPGEVGWAVVVLEAPPTPERLAALAARVDVLREWTLLPAVGVVGSREALLAVAAEPDVRRVDAATGELLLRQSADQVGAPAVWHGPGLTGAVVTIAILDTGIDDRHPDLAGGKVVARASFETFWPGLPASGTEETPGGLLLDLFGHGTHVASTAAGAGVVPGVLHYPDDRYRGVAPDASLVSVQVSTTGGVTAFGGAVTTWAAIDAIEWVVANRAAHGIRVATNSWGFSMQFHGYATCLAAPVSQAVQAALDAAPDLVWVFAAGNAGDPETIGAPGCLPGVVTVGAVDRANERASFSSQGPTRGDHHPKPDVVAPGVGIVAAQPVNPSAYAALGAVELLAGGDAPRDIGHVPFYAASSGTSMATPHVAGIVALMLEAAPCLTHAQVLAALHATAIDLGPAGYDHGYGHGLAWAPGAVAAVAGACP